MPFRGAVRTARRANGSRNGMITIISGNLGAGKSFDCVRLIRDHIAAGGCVRTNIRLNLAQLSASVHRRLSPAQIGLVSADDDPKLIPTGDRRGHGSRRTIVLLDEALNWFQSSAGAVKDERKKPWSEWLRQSDKLGQDVWFIAQRFDRTAKWIRELAQVSVEIFALREFKLGMVFPLWLIFPPLKNMYCVKRRDVRSGQVIGLEIHPYSDKIKALYDTSETFGFVGAQSAYDGVRLWPRYRSPVWALAVVLGVDLICVAVIVISYLF